MGCGRQRVKEGEMSVECEGEGKPEKGGETGAFKGFRSGGDGWGEFSMYFCDYFADLFCGSVCIILEKMINLVEGNSDVPEEFGILPMV